MSGIKLKITNIDTFIKNKFLYISIFVENLDYPFTCISFETFKESFKNNSILEIDILRECYLEPSSFYKYGELMPNQLEVANRSNFYPKTYAIYIPEPISNLMNKDYIKNQPFFLIHSVKSINKKGKEPFVIIRDYLNQVYFMKVTQFNNIVGLDENQYFLLKGTFISPVFFQKGELNDYRSYLVEIKEDGKIIKSLNIRIMDSLDVHFEKFSCFAKSQNTFIDDNFIKQILSLL